MAQDMKPTPAQGTPSASERLYYRDAYLTDFDGEVVAVRDVDGKTALALDRSAFYPASGGQPSDTGTLGPWCVVDVVAEDEQVWHVLAASPELPEGAPGAGQRLRGVVDWARRYDHMQQHTGQHLLSQVFERLYGYETVSVHIGAEENTLDLQTPTLDAEQMEATGALVTDRVYAALPVRVYIVDEAGLARVPLRRPPKVRGEIRIVEIEGYDYSACGGTHCRTTAEAGPIQILRTERRRGIVRVTFVCGRRAAEDYRRKHRLLVETAALFSTEIGQTPALVERNLALVKEQQRRIEELTARLAVAEAAQMLARAETLPDGGRLIADLSDERDAGALRALASTLIEESGVVALLASQQDGKLLLTFARHAQAAGHMGNLLRAVLQEAGGSGGGRSDYAQGGGVDAALGAQLLARAREMLIDAIQPATQQ